MGLLNLVVEGLDQSKRRVSVLRAGRAVFVRISFCLLVFFLSKKSDVPIDRTASLAHLFSGDFTLKKGPISIGFLFLSFYWPLKYDSA